MTAVHTWRMEAAALAARWTASDPSVDVGPFMRALESLGDSTAAAAMTAVRGLGEVWVERRPGAWSLDFAATREQQGAAREWLLSSTDAASPALVLALRSEERQVPAGAAGILGKLRPAAALPALLSVLEHPESGLAQCSPDWAIRQYGHPTGAVAARLVAALDNVDFRVAVGAAKVLCEYAEDDELFEALWSHRARADAEDGYAWALMRAAERRPDPRLRGPLASMLQGMRFSSPGYRDRIRKALAGLPEM